MLSGYDAGAFEARPVPVESTGISGIPYLQVNSTESFALSITPSDASLNVTEYPPHGAVWQSSNPAVISVDNSGTVKALGVGSAYITAAVYGWDASGNPLSPSATSKAFRVYAGEEPRNPMKATVLSIDEVSVRPGSYILVKPVVSLDINGIILENPSGGVNYSLSAESSRLDIVTAEIVSGDTVRLLGGSEVSEVSCDVTVKAHRASRRHGRQHSFHRERYRQCREWRRHWALKGRRRLYAQHGRNFGTNITLQEGKTLKCSMKLWTST